MSLSAPNSEIAICNLALDHLKQDSIVSIDPPSTMVEKVCARWYQQVRRATLRKHPWNFAIKRIQLTPDSVAPTFGFTHRYLKPTDFVRYIGQYDDLGNRVGDADYDLEGEYLLLNGEDSESINIRYVSDYTTVAKFDPLFIDLFAIDFAIRIAPKFSGTENRVKVLIELRKDINEEARAIDGQERPPRRVQTSKFITARRGGTNLSGGASPFTHFR